MEKEFVPYEIALALKELGFDEPCFGFYGGLSPLGDRYYYDSTGYNRNSDTGDSDGLHCTRALYQQAFRWFREKHSLYSCVNTFTEELNDDILYFIYEIRNPEQFELSEVYKTYEEAELACLKKLIEIVKNGK